MSQFRDALIQAAHLIADAFERDAAMREAAPDHAKPTRRAPSRRPPQVNAPVSDIDAARAERQLRKAGILR